MKIFSIVLLLLISLSMPYYPDGKEANVAHVSVSTMLVLSTHAVLYYSGVDKYNRMVYSFLIPFSVGLGKEIYDENTNGYFDPLDMAYNSLGISIGMAFILIF